MATSGKLHCNLRVDKLLVGERRRRGRSGGTGKSCCERPRYDGDADADAEKSSGKIYAVYGGQTSVTDIINGLKRDKKDGTLNPNFKT